MRAHRTSEEDQGILSLRHHVQRSISYQLKTLFPPVQNLSTTLSEQLARLSRQHEGPTLGSRAFGDGRCAFLESGDHRPTKSTTLGDRGS